MKRLMLAVTVFISGLASAAPLTLSMYESGEIASAKINLPTETWAQKSGITEKFNGLTLVKNKRYEDAIAYVQSQTYIHKYNLNSLVKHGFMLEYMIQNADNQNQLDDIVGKVNHVEMCLYFAYDDSIRFVQDRMIRMLTDDDNASDRLKAATSYMTGKVSELNIPEQNLKLQIVQCGELVK
ncbi:hypothetical protein [Vibrio sp. D431a]|uniref:hypothetical protein n=1 Tax=Vibrio sp. D431a TaxID=2837388 RepID=UPI0025547B2D|nr:hypothetical protein [Vibrio sp. D431a]MDK9790612.1 hypothetical protein [Vibrio sp. D431a]